MLLVLPRLPQHYFAQKSLDWKHHVSPALAERGWRIVPGQVARFPVHLIAISRCAVQTSVLAERSSLLLQIQYVRKAGKVESVTSNSLGAYSGERLRKSCYVIWLVANMT